ncbi:ABC transporter ATP-binding protein [Paraflavitalea pollutisoli]|uniref:ATP-binding cassette domain-containing protein n=1 Tax=Paraflavitalea pollutisoli TaxID=3034143 RepID=UPI0023EE00F7|nr:ABC transporter ATP-binding protein [Paraflavitalea sp. H1-2-19X]
MKHIIQKTISILSQDERRRLGLLALLDLFVALADIACLALLLLIVRLYTQPATAPGIPWLPTPMQDRHRLLPIASFLLLFAVKNFAGFDLYRRQCRFLATVATRMARSRLLQYLEGAYTNFINVDSSVHIRRISYQPIDFCQHILAGLQTVITQTGLIVLTITAILLFNAQLFLLLFLLLLPPVIGISYLVKRRLRQVRSETRHSSEKALQHLQEALNGFVESNIYNRNKDFLERYMQRQQQFNTHFANTLIAQGLPTRLMEVFALTGLFLLIALHQWGGYAGPEAIITIGAFMAAAYKIIPGIVKILNTIGQIQTYGYTADDLQDIPPTSTDHQNGVKKEQEQPNSFPSEASQSVGHQTTTPDPNGAATAHIPSPIRHIAFDQVSFSFGQRTVLRHLSWSLEAGDFLGISGHSGQGKTTILNLLLGFLQPQQGRILINGQPADRQQRRQYWPSISYVKQQPFLVNDTLQHNVTLQQAPHHTQKLQHSLHSAGLSTLFQQDSADNLIAEQGRNISGGQRQRIAIARALYKDADLIILDEPFNELDAAAELALLQHFQSLCQQGRIVILITHHQQSLSFCNKILRLDA